MPKDNRGTLAAFDDLLSSLEGMVDDIEDDIPAPSETDNEFYDFYFEINNVPRKASNAKIIPPSSSLSIPPHPPHKPSPPPPTINSYDYNNNNYNEVTTPQNDIDSILNDLLAPLDSTPSPSLPPPPPIHHPTPPPKSSTIPAPQASSYETNSHINISSRPASSLIPPSPPNKANGTLKPKPAPPKLQNKPPGKTNPNKSNLSLKKPTAKPAGSQLLLERSQNVANIPYEPPQRFMSRGSYNTGASQVDAAPPPQTKEIPQRFLSTGSYNPSQHNNPPPVPPSASPSRNPFPAPPQRNTNAFAKEPPQRFHSTNTYTNPSNQTKEPVQRFFSTNNFNKGASHHNPDVQRNTYIGNRASQPFNNTSSSPPAMSTSPPLQPKSPQNQQNSQYPPQSYNSNPSSYQQPAPSYNSPPQANNLPPNSQYPPQSYNPNPPSYQQPAPQSYNPPQSNNNSQSYYPDPDPVPVREDSSRGKRSGNINSRKSVRIPKSEIPQGTRNYCAKCGDLLEGEHMMAMNRYWCPTHFTCHECNRELHGSFSEENGHPFCSDCLSIKYACVSCGKGVISGQYFLTEHGRRHAECMPVTICDMCQNPIRAGTTKMKALDKTFHPECFRCVSCSKVIEGEFTNRSGSPLCIACSQVSQPKCAKCYQSLSGHYKYMFHIPQRNITMNVLLVRIATTNYLYLVFT